jgi:predicted transcriptional regulator
MTVVNSKKFATNDDKYFDLALNERVFVKKGNNMFIVTTANEYDDDDDDAEMLALAKERANDEDTSADEFLKFIYELAK